MTNNTPVKYRTNNVAIRTVLASLAVTLGLPEAEQATYADKPSVHPLVTVNKSGEFHFSSNGSLNDGNCKEVELPELLRVMGTLKSAPTVSVKVNETYTAVVSKDNIKVGCQTIQLSVIDELVKARAEVLA